MKEWEEGISKWRADKVKSAFKKKHGRSLSASRKPFNSPRKRKYNSRHSRFKKHRLHRVSPKIQKEWAEGVSQWVAQRKVVRSNHYFLKKFGIIKGNCSEEWKEGIQVWLDQGLLNKSWKWRASKGKFMPSRNRRRKKRFKSVISGKNRFRLKSHTLTKRKKTLTASTNNKAIREELKIYVLKNEQQLGPHSLDEIEEFLVNSQINLGDLALYNGCEDWIKVFELPNLKFKREPKQPEDLIPEKKQQVADKPSVRNPDETSQKNRPEKVFVSRGNNPSGIQIDPRKPKRKSLTWGSASLILISLIAGISYYLNLRGSQNIDVADRNYTEKPDASIVANINPDTSHDNLTRNFYHGFKHLDDSDADKHLFEQSGIKKYSEWQSSPITYFGPSRNNQDATLTYKYSFDGTLKSAKTRISLSVWNKNYRVGGTSRASGQASAWASKDGANWVNLIDIPTPTTSLRAEKTFEDILPSTVLGSNDLYLQFRMKVSKDRHSFSTPAQFGRSDANANKNIFYLDANYSSDMDEEKMLLLMEL